jgi:hypothetical protein
MNNDLICNTVIPICMPSHVIKFGNSENEIHSEREIGYGSEMPD